MNYCRRCGQSLQQTHDHIYACGDHTIFANSSPATAVALINENNEVLVTRRNLEPNKNMLDLPGGFVDGNETFEAGIIRELQEEVGLNPGDYSELQYLLSAFDEYNYSNEDIPVLTALYWARIKGRPSINFDKEINEILYIPIKDLVVDDFAFNSNQEAVRKLQQL